MKTQDASAALAGDVTGGSLIFVHGEEDERTDEPPIARAGRRLGRMVSGLGCLSIEMIGAFGRRRWPRGQRLRQFVFEFGPSFLQRTVKDIISYVHPTPLVGLQLVYVAIFERAGGKGQLFCAVINEHRAFDKLATVKSRQN